jgi:hypothetical protein
MRKAIYIVICLLVRQYVTAQVTVYNDGMATVSIVSGCTVSILGGYISQTRGGVNGKIDNQGTLQLTGDWTNNNSAATPNVFSTSAGTVAFNGTAVQTIGGTAATTFYNLTFNNDPGVAGNVTLATNNYVATNQITMTQGIVNLNSRTLTLGASGGASTLSRAANTWLYGGTFSRYWLNATAISSTAGNYYGLFPMGESTASSYSPLEINSTVSPGSNGNFSVTYTASPGNYTDLSPLYNDAGTNIERILSSSFNTSLSGIASGTYNINVTMTGINSTGALSDIRLALSTGGTTASAVGTHAAATGTVANPTAKRTALSSADLAKDFRLASSNKGATPLPVTLLYFDVKPNGNTVDIQWSTATEFNNDYFIVQRSQNNLHYEDIVKVDGAGTSTILKNYFTVDQNPYTGMSYYRLKQVDYNGSYKYSSIIPVEFNAEIVFDVFPSISFGDFNMIFSGQKDKELRCVVLDLLGKKYYSTVYMLENDVNIIPINLSGKVAPGLYTVVVSNNQQTFSKRIVVQ